MSAGDPAGYVGRALERLEDAALVTGRGRYGDDLPVSIVTISAWACGERRIAACTVRGDTGTSSP